MRASRSVAKNTILLSVGLLAGRFLSVFVWRKMAPILGPGGVGICTLAIDISAIMVTVANFGLGTLITREIGRDRRLTRPVFLVSSRIRLGLGLLCYAALLAYARLSGFSGLQQAALLVMGLAVFLETEAMACDAVLQAHEKVEFQTLGQLASAVVYVGLAFWWLDLGLGVMGIIWANIASRVVRLGVMAPFMAARTGPWLRQVSGAPDVRAMTRMAWPLFLATTFGVLTYKFDMLLLMAFLGERSVGIYALGHRALDYLVYAPNIFATALFPAMVRYAAASGQDAARLSERALRYMVLAVLPLTFFCMLVAAPLTRWLAGGAEEFADSIVVFRIVVWGMPFQAISLILNRMLITGGHERVFVRIVVVSLAVNLGLNLLLIPRYGYFGSSWAVVASLATGTLQHFYYIWRMGLSVPWRRALGGPALALGAAWLAAVALARTVAPAWGTDWLALPLTAGWGPLLAVTGLTGGLYAAAIAGLRVLTGADLALLRQLARRDEEG